MIRPAVLAGAFLGAVVGIVGAGLLMLLLSPPRDTGMTFLEIGSSVGTLVGFFIGRRQASLGPRRDGGGETTAGPES
jgi:predicted lipid-binding transport protein (Tim44 family)